jgi:hypothetical protein
MIGWGLLAVGWVLLEESRSAMLAAGKSTNHTVFDLRLFRAYTIPRRMEVRQEMNIPD